MKTKLFSSLFACLSAIIFIGCTPEVTPSYLNVSNSTINLSYEGDDIAVNVEANTSWRITGAKAWVNISQKQGDGSAIITIGADENENIEGRSCKITFTTDDGTLLVPVTINQDATPTNLSLDTHNLEFKEDSGQTKSFTVNSNDSWKISGVPKWIDLSRTEGVGVQSITVTTLSANLSDQSRTAELEITSGNNREMITVTQAPAWTQNCKVNVIDDIFTMCDGMVFNVEMSKNMDYFYAYILLEEEQVKYSLNEIVELAVESGEKYTESGIYTIENLIEDTSFIIYFIPFKNDPETGNPKQGTPTSLNFKTKSSSFEPRVFISDPTYDQNYWYYSFTKSSYCHKYYTLVSSDIDMFLYYPDLFIAYVINETIVANEPPMLESGSWYSSMSSNGFIALYALGVRENGELSGTLDWNIGLTEGLQSKAMSVEARKVNKSNRMSHEEFNMLKKKISESL